MAYISVITDSNNLLTKHFSYEEGKLNKSAPGHLVKGTIEAVDVDVIKLIDVIKGLNQHQCLCLGVLDQPGVQDIYCGKLGTPTRSKEYLNFYPNNSFLLLDFDDSGKTPEQAIEILSEIDPQFSTCGLAVIPSSSSYLYNGDEEVVGEGNYHIFVELRGARDPEVYGNILFDRLLAYGFCTPKITKAGSIVIKSLFDKVVLSPEREIFSADPVCDGNLTSKRLENISWQIGPVLDSDAIEDISEDERMNIRLMIKNIREDLHEKSAKRRKEYYVEIAKRKAAEKGTSYLTELPNILDTEIYYDKQGRPIIELVSSDMIMDEDGKMFYIRDLLLDPVEGVKLPDPVEPYKRGDEKKGIPGRGVATVLNTIIYSHHHCGIIYLMKWDVSDVINIMTDGDFDQKLLVWRMLSTGAQELSSATTEAEISELSDVIKNELSKHKEAKTGKEKKHIQAKLHAATIPDIAEVDKVLDMNAKYGVVNHGGRAVIVSEHWNSAAQEFDTMFTIPSSLDVLTKNIPMRIPGVSQPVSLYKYWEQHAERRTFEEIVFEPNAKTFRAPGRVRAMPNTKKYNLFQGYMYEPSKATECDLILTHIKEVWCSNDEVEYNYVIGWLANLFQNPEKLSQTALVLQSVPGAGKGIIIENCIVKALGVHAISTSRADDLVGRFNKHLGMNIFFYANEMEYAAQHSVKSMLKTLVETDTRMVEAKNIDRVKTRNYTSLIVSANGEWVLNIEHGDRRFVYLTVSSSRVGDFEYFKRLKEQIDNGGKDAFVKYLLKYDLSKYKSGEFPDRCHHQRKADFLRSANPIIKFVWSLFDTDFGVGHFSADPMYKQLKEWQDFGNCELVLTKSQLFSLYREYCDYYKIDRKYDDSGTIAMQMEVGGVLKRESDPRDEFVLRRKQKDKKEVYVLKSVNDGKQLLKV